MTAMQASEAFEFLAKPNEAVVSCEASPSLPVDDVIGERASLVSRLQSTIASFSLPSADFATELYDQIHVSAREREDGVPIYHPVNYQLSSVDYFPYYAGERERASATNYDEVTAHFGCTEPITIDSLTIPVQDALPGTSGSIRVVSLDFDLILCDMMMPRTSGMELHKWLISCNRPLSDRILFITGGIFTPKAREYLNRVALQTIEKPFDVEKVRNLVDERVLA